MLRPQVGAEGEGAEGLEAEWGKGRPSLGVPVFVTCFLGWCTVAAYLVPTRYQSTPPGQWPFASSMSPHVAFRTTGITQYRYPKMRPPTFFQLMGVLHALHGT